MTEPTTIQYRLNLSNALLPISPALSALHTSRAAALHPQVSAVLLPSHCLKCGTYRFSGDHPPTRRKRKRGTSSRSKSLQRKCHLCDFPLDPAACTGPSPSDSSRTGARPTTIEIAQESPSTESPRPIAGTVPLPISAPVPPLPARQAHPKSRHTKTPTLRDMLSRDRQREEGAKAHEKRKEDHKGLAAFLKQL